MSLPKKEMERKKGNVGSLVLISMLRLSLCMNYIVHVRCLNFSCACLIVQQAINEFGNSEIHFWCIKIDFVCYVQADVHLCFTITGFL